MPKLEASAISAQKVRAAANGGCIGGMGWKKEKTIAKRPMGNERVEAESERNKYPSLMRGTGIPSENLERIFDLYFGTRQRGAQKGMAPGPATARAIVAGCGGKIQVESRVGQGSVFYIYLPAHSTRAE